jgi:hypothetical protein
MICFAIFIGPENTHQVRVNGELIKKGDPRFYHEVTVARLVQGFMGLFFYLVAAYIFGALGKNPQKNRLPTNN